MVKVMTLSVAILVISSAAFAQIDLQYQGWNLGLTNSIALSNGAGTGSTIQGIGTLNVQDLGVNPNSQDVPTTTASQGIIAALFQDGNAETEGKGNISLEQTMGVTGLGITVNGTPLLAGQTQMIGDGGDSSLQYEGASVVGGQTLEKGSGAAANADGLNLVGFAMGQTGGNNCVDGCQLSVIIGGQFSELVGTAQGVGTITTGASATVQQFQTANNAAQP